MDYEHKTRRKGERLTLSLMLALTRNHGELEHQYSEMLNAPFAYTGKMMTDKERFKEYTFQIDWLRPLGKGHQLEIGAGTVEAPTRPQLLSGHQQHRD